MWAKLLSFFSNKYTQWAIAFALGGTLAVLMVPEKIVTKTEIKVVERVVTVEKVLTNTKTVTRRVITPSATTEDITTETVAQETGRAERDTNTTTVSLREQASRKRFTAYGGLGIEPGEVLLVFTGGLLATVWGPFTVGAYADSHPTVGLTFGVTW